MKYKITIEELLCKTVEVEAESPTAAMNKVHDMYSDELITLTADDFSEVTFGINTNK